MKHWKVSYSIKYKDGHIEKQEATLEAEAITSATYKAFANIAEPAHRIPEIEAVVIWSVCIIEDDVF